MSNIINVRTAKMKFSSILHKAHLKGEHFLITKNNTPWVIIIGVQEYEDLLDRVDTMTEQLDPAFQESLRVSMEEYRKGETGTIDDIRAILRSKSDANSA